MFMPLMYNAKAEIKGSSKYKDIKGTVYFGESKKGVIITVKITGLPTVDKGEGRFFAFHIHSGALCTGDKEDEFKNAKSHYNPKNFQHPFHAGDLPPLIEAGGEAYMKVLVNKFKINDIIGKTVIIHDKPDDFKTQPSGDAGNKIACGEIVRI